MSDFNLLIPNQSNTSSVYHTGSNKMYKSQSNDKKVDNETLDNMNMVKPTAPVEDYHQKLL